MTSDGVDNVYIAGGLGYGASTSFGSLSDIWRYKISSNMWTRIGGSANPSEPRNLGTYGIESAVSTPGRRWGAPLAFASNSLWQYGGFNGPSDYFNDIWRYNLTSGLWTWVGGDSFTNGLAYLGTQFMEGSNVKPQARLYSSLVGLNDYVYLFGGWYDGSTPCSELFRFSTKKHQWTWLGGSGLNGVYNDRRSSNSTTMPGARFNVGLSASSQFIATFGGAGYGSSGTMGNLNDLFILTLPQIAPTTTASTSSAQNSATNMNIITSPPTVSSPETGSDFFGSLYFPLIVGALVLFTFALTICVVVVNRKCIAHPATKSMSTSHLLATPGSHQTKKAPSTIYSATKTQMSTTSTIVDQSPILALPGYLQLRIGHEFRKDEQIAVGGAGKIFMCTSTNPELTHRSDGKLLVFKELAPSLDQVTVKQFISFNQEVSLAHALRDCDNIMAVYGFSLSPVGLIVKYYYRGDLMDYLLGTSFVVKTNPMTKHLLVSLFRGWCNGIAVMHEFSYAHCDIKPANVLLDVDSKGALIAVVSDFGIARVLSDHELKVKAFEVANTEGVTIVYGAPERIQRFKTRGAKPDMLPDIWKAGDVYSLSIGLYELLTRTHAWE
jgi:hypothetical protein